MNCLTHCTHTERDGGFRCCHCGDPIVVSAGFTDAPPHGDKAEGPTAFPVMMPTYRAQG